MSCHVKDNVLTAAVAAALLLGLGACAGAAPSADRGPLISNVFLDTDLREALQDVAHQAGVHIIPDDSVGGLISLDLQDVPLEDALRMMLMGGGYVFREVSPDCYLVSSGDPKSPSFNLVSETAIIPLRYIRADAVTDLLLSDYYTDYLKVDAAKNLVCVTGPRSVIERVAADIARIDRLQDQVLIEALIIDVEIDKAKEFLSDWRVTEGVESPEGTRSVFFEGLTLGYTSLQMREVLLSLRALVTNGIARIRAEPSVTTLDGEQAEIFVGREEYFSILAGGTISYPYYRLETIESGIKLKILPRVVEPDLITLRFSPEVSEVVARGEEGLPVVSRRTVSTTVRVRDGETVAVGGLASELLRREKTGVPILGDIPLIGLLFSSTQTQSRKGDVIVLLTPHLIRGPGLIPVSEPPGYESPEVPSSDTEAAVETGRLPAGPGGAAPSAPPATPADSPQAPPAPVALAEETALERAQPDAVATDASAGGGQLPPAHAAADPTPAAPAADEAAVVEVADGGAQASSPHTAPLLLSRAGTPSSSDDAAEPTGKQAEEGSSADAQGPQKAASASAEEASGDAKPGEDASSGGAVAPTTARRQPSLAVIAPSPNAVLTRGQVADVKLGFSSDRELYAIWLYVNGQAYAKVTKAPYQLKWETGSLPEGRHKLRAYARLVDGEWLRSETVWVDIVEEKG